MENNIFIFGKAVSGENFIDRKEETERIRMAFENGANVILSSPRRMGKTSLIKKVKSLVDPQKTIVVFMDIFSCRSEEDFYKMFLLSVLKQTSGKVEDFLNEAKAFFGRISTNISIGSLPDPESALSVSLGMKPRYEEPEGILNLPEKIAGKKNIRIVICIDEFQQIGDFSDSLGFQKRLRSVWQHQQYTSYCLFGSKKHLMDALFLKKSYPFYKFGNIIPLGTIDNRYWVEYIVRQFESTEKHISEEQALRICNEVEGQPSYIQELAWLIWARTPHGENVSDAIFTQALQDLTDENIALFQSQTVGLSTYQMNFLRAVKDGVHQGFTRKEIYTEYELGTAANITRIKKALTDKELIETKDNKVYFTDPIMKKWFE